MNHSLTQKQLDCLRWLVNLIKSGKIEEPFTAGNGAGCPLFILGLKDEEIPKNYTLGDLKALAAKDVLIRYGHEYSSTDLAYEIIAAPTNQSNIGGDIVRGDKVGGDKVMGDKHIHYHSPGPGK